MSTIFCTQYGALHVFSSQESETNESSNVDNCRSLRIIYWNTTRTLSMSTLVMDRQHTESLIVELLTERSYAVELHIQEIRSELLFNITEAGIILCLTFSCVICHLPKLWDEVEDVMAMKECCVGLLRYFVAIWTEELALYLSNNLKI